MVSIRRRQLAQRFGLLVGVSVLVIDAFDACDGVAHDALGMLARNACAAHQRCARFAANHGSSSERRQTGARRSRCFIMASPLIGPSVRALANTKGFSPRRGCARMMSSAAFGSIRLPAESFSRFSCGIVHSPSSEMSAHRMVMIFARRCAVSRAMRTKAPNVPLASAAFQTCAEFVVGKDALAHLFFRVLAAHARE